MNENLKQKLILTETQKESILEWTADIFPMEVRTSAAIVFADYIRGINNNDIEYFIKPLQFGTGGLRGLIGNGSGRMNIWTVGKVTLALSRMLLNKKKPAHVVIAYDSRHKSKDFASACAGVLVGEGIKVSLFEKVTPTPILSFAVRFLKADAGIVITASHNPPEYNGYKVYNETGAQIVGTFQSNLENEILKIKSWDEIKFIFENTNEYKKNVKLIGSEILKAYIKELEKQKFVTSPKNPKKKNIKIVYTPLHGTGRDWMLPVLKHFGFNVTVVSEQAKPDGNFPTVKYPNPEEEIALVKAEELAIKLKANIFLATDPDADRLGSGVRDEKGNYNYYNGNQIGSIMCAFLCENFYTKKDNEKENYIFKTIVTTDLQKKIALAHGSKLIEVLTGFKYIAAEISKLESKNSKHKSNFIFGGEESFGYLPVEFVRDKDSISSALLLCEILCEYGDLGAYLDQIYLRYGLYMEDLKSITLKGSNGEFIINQALSKLRKENLNNWKLGNRKVVEVLDYQNQKRNSKIDNNYFKNFPKSNILQFNLEPFGKLTIRPSGTEPKIKLYLSLSQELKTQNLKELKKAKQILRNELTDISGQFLNHTGLLAKVK